VTHGREAVESVVCVCVRARVCACVCVCVPALATRGDLKSRQRADTERRGLDEEAKQDGIRVHKVRRRANKVRGGIDKVRIRTLSYRLYLSTSARAREEAAGRVRSWIDAVFMWTESG
jgi:hypothetical protein